MTDHSDIAFIATCFALALMAGTFVFSFFDPATTFLMCETNP